MTTPTSFINRRILSQDERERALCEESTKHKRWWLRVVRTTNLSFSWRSRCQSNGSSHKDTTPRSWPKIFSCFPFKRPRAVSPKRASLFFKRQREIMVIFVLLPLSLSTKHPLAKKTLLAKKDPSSVSNPPCDGITLAIRCP